MMLVGSGDGAEDFCVVLSLHIALVETIWHLL